MKHGPTDLVWEIQAVDGKVLAHVEYQRMNNGKVDILL